MNGHSGIGDRDESFLGCLGAYAVECLDIVLALLYNGVLNVERGGFCSKV
jgi:hypothetical protein